MKNKVIRILAFILSLFYISQVIFASSNEQKNSPDLIDIMNQQKILVHQVLVSYIQISRLKKHSNQNYIRKTSINNFEENLSVLKSDENIKVQLMKIQFLWNKLKKIALTQQNKESIIKLIELNEDIITLCNKIISTSVIKNNTDSDIVNISEQQKMLSQRIALFMLMENWEFDGVYTEEMYNSLNDYYKNIVFLTNYENNTSEINKSIKLSKKSFISLMNIIYQDGNKKDYPLEISRYTDQLLHRAKNITKLYINLNNAQSKTR